MCHKNYTSQSNSGHVIVLYFLAKAVPIKRRNFNTLKNVTFVFKKHTSNRFVFLRKENVFLNFFELTRGRNEKCCNSANIEILGESWLKYALNIIEFLVALVFSTFASNCRSFHGNIQCQYIHSY